MLSQCWCVRKDERAAVCTWIAGPAAAQTWHCQHFILPGPLCLRTGNNDYIGAINTLLYLALCATCCVV